MMGHTHRFWHANVLAKELLDSGAIGRIARVRDVIFSQRNERYSRPWHADNALAGGGIFMNSGVHAADRLRWWLGDEVVSVAARLGRASELYQGEDHGTALLTFSHGAVATMEISVGAARAADACYAEFYGTEGALRVDSWEGVRLAGPTGEWQSVPLPRGKPDGFAAEILAFADAVCGEAPVPVTGQDGIAALEIVQAIYASDRQGTTVPVTHPPVLPLVP
jgi:predicted dehydrogenase